MTPLLERRGRGRPDKGKEVSPGGSEIHRHKDPKKRAWTPPAAVGVFAEEVCSRFEELFPERETFVYHEIVSDLVHIDVNVMRPGPEDDCFVIFTTGMSDLPMTLPDDLKDRDDLRYAELFMFLPRSWNPGGPGTLGSEMRHEDSWPIEAIKFLARFPHEYGTWLCGGHTIPNGEGYEPILEGSEMSGFLLLHFGEDYEIDAKDGRRVTAYMVAPVTRAETEYKLEYGTDALVERFVERDVQLVTDMYRGSAV